VTVKRQQQANFGEILARLFGFYKIIGFWFVSFGWI